VSLSTPDVVTAPSQPNFGSSRRRERRERAFRLVLQAALALAVLVLGVLIVDVMVDGLGWLDWQFITNFWSRTAAEAGIWAGITGTLSLMVLVAVISVGIGIGAAVYLEEFAPDNRFTRLMEANITNLAGVPSVVYGLLALGIFIGIIGMARALLIGAFALALLVLPVIITASREAMRAVPDEIREGGLALGATPLQVVRSQVLPPALPGILTGVILALSRAIGEAAPILVVGAVFSRYDANAPWEPFEQFVALPIQIYNAIGFPQETFQISVASAGIVVMLGLLLSMNSIAIWLRNRWRRF